MPTMCPEGDKHANKQTNKSMAMYHEGDRQIIKQTTVTNKQIKKTNKSMRALCHEGAK